MRYGNIAGPGLRNDALIVVYHPTDLPRIMEDPVWDHGVSGSGEDSEVRRLRVPYQGIELEFSPDIDPGYPFPPPREDVAREVSRWAAEQADAERARQLVERHRNTPTDGHERDG